MSKISNGEQAIDWANANPGALVKRDCECSFISPAEKMNVEYLFGNFWSEILVATGVEENGFIPIFKPLSTFDAIKQEFPRSNEKYVESPDECPYCGSLNITSEGEHTISGSSLYNQCSCYSCEKAWVESYQLVGYVR